MTGLIVLTPEDAQRSSALGCCFAHLPKVHAF